MEIQVHKTNEESSLTNKTILAQLGRVYDPLGIISPSMVEDNWTKQLRHVKVPRSLINGSASIDAVDTHQFADASNLACSTVAITVIEQGSMSV